MNTRDDHTITRTNATAFEAPTLVFIGDAESVVLGIPWGGHDHFGYAPPQFEFQEDNDDHGGPSGRTLPE